MTLVRQSRRRWEDAYVFITTKMMRSWKTPAPHGLAGNTIQNDDYVATI